MATELTDADVGIKPAEMSDADVGLKPANWKDPQFQKQQLAKARQSKSEATETATGLLNQPLVDIKDGTTTVFGHDFTNDKVQKEIQHVEQSGTPREKALLGAHQAFQQFASSLTSPLSIGTLGVGGFIKGAPALKRGLSLIFAGLAFKHVAVDIKKQLVDEYSKPPDQRDPQAIARAWTDAGLSGATAGVIAADAVAPSPKTSLTPKTDAAVAATKGGEIPNAKTIRGDTGQPQAPGIQPEGSQADSGGDVQQAPPRAPDATRQAQKEVLTSDQLQKWSAAIKLPSGEVFTGKTHAEIYPEAKKTIPDTSGAQEGFVDHDGNFISREVAAQRTGFSTEVEPGKLHSSDLLREQAALAPKTPAGASEAQPVSSGGEAGKTPPAGNQTRFGSNVGQNKVQNQNGFLATVFHPVVDKATGETVKPQVQIDEIRNGQNVRSSVPDEELKSMGLPTRAELASKEPGQHFLGDVQQPPAKGEIVNMGQVGKEDLSSEGSRGREIYGVAQRIREERAAASVGPDVPIGKGISPEASVEQGRKLLDAGADHEKSMTALEQGKGTPEDFMVARAHGERLAQQAREIERTSGTDSQEYRDALQKSFDWDTRYKKGQTAWGKAGSAQQGETDIDTGSFTGLAREYKSNTGEDFTPKQEKQAKEKAETVTKQEDKTQQAQGALDSGVKDVKPAAEDPQVVATRKALKAAQEAADSAQKQADESVKQSGGKKKGPTKAEQRAIDAANRTVRNAAAAKAKAEQNALANPERSVWNLMKGYLNESGGKFKLDDLVNRAATDLGISASKVRNLMNRKPQLKTLADNVWREQQNLRRVKQSAKRWLAEQSQGAFGKTVGKIPRTMFSLRIAGHGAVALGTHAPMGLFRPSGWSDYFKSYGQMYRMLASPAHYEMLMGQQVRDPNFRVANQAGLVNDPYQYEDYTDPRMAEYFGPLIGAGNRGFAVLKLYRQRLFNAEWDSLAQTEKTPEMAKSIADDVNHFTGVTKAMAPKGAATALFAPRLLASRAAWIFGDPIKAARIGLDWNNASVEEKRFALQQVRKKAEVGATLMALLSANQGLLIATGSKKKINGVPEALGGKGIHPLDPDFMKFKVGDYDVAYGSAMLNMMKFPVRVVTAISDAGQGKNKYQYEQQATGDVFYKLARSQESPFASTVTDLMLGRDYEERPLPRKLFGIEEGDKTIPKWLRQEGVKEPYTWGEYATQQAMPIPFEEAAREVWRAKGMNSSQMNALLKAIPVTIIQGGTGARITKEDTE